MKIENVVATPHIRAEKNQIAKVVIMPGDPLRAKFIAETFLENPHLVNNVRNMFMYTGKYQGKEVTVAGSGMGMPSIGIYSFELFKFYDVDCIIRVGSAGSYQENVKVYDVINVKEAYSESTFAKYAANIESDIIASSVDIFDIINKTDEKLFRKATLKTGLIHSSDVFYRAIQDEWKTNSKIKNCLAVEMESFALFANAKFLNKSAACLLTISDSFITGESISAEKREKSFQNMMRIALESAVAFLGVKNKW